MVPLPQQWTGWRGWTRDLAFAAAVGLCLGLIGPFGTYLSPLPFRLVYWTGLLCAGMPLYGLAIRAALWSGRRSGVPAAVWLLAFSFVGSAPMSALSAVVATHFWPPLKVITALEWYGQSLALSLPLVMVWGVLTRRMAPFARPTPQKEDTVRPGELPERLTRGLICLQMEDHYVRVHTRSGSELVLLSMREAMAQLGARRGERVHRSWWVAREAVIEAVSDGRNLRLRLVGGLEAPVSRTQVGRLRALGWFGGPDDEAATGSRPA
ncbi:MAG TPA: LytTR family DNA-binding domain-containing protein [Caulobacteraceae bacterium]|nr:LytTR family DNA-binding domain-containing protein [Caulobacteraceae bacterium]